MSGRNGSEQVSGIGRNQCPPWPGIRTVTEGGEFNGKIEMKMDEVKALDFEAKVQEGPIVSPEVQT
jgi:hypothetical protein